MVKSGRSSTRANTAGWSRCFTRRGGIAGPNGETQSRPIGGLQRPPGFQSRHPRSGRHPFANLCPRKEPQTRERKMESGDVSFGNVQNPHFSCALRDAAKLVQSEPPHSGFPSVVLFRKPRGYGHKNSFPHEDSLAFAGSLVMLGGKEYGRVRAGVGAARGGSRLVGSGQWLVVSG